MQATRDCAVNNHRRFIAHGVEGPAMYCYDCGVDDAYQRGQRDAVNHSVTVEAGKKYTVEAPAGTISYWIGGGGAAARKDGEQ